MVVDAAFHNAAMRRASRRRSSAKYCRLLTAIRIHVCILHSETKSTHFFHIFAQIERRELDDFNTIPTVASASTVLETSGCVLIFTKKTWNEGGKISIQMWYKVLVFCHEMSRRTLSHSKSTCPSMDTLKPVASLISVVSQGQS